MKLSRLLTLALLVIAAPASAQRGGFPGGGFGGPGGGGASRLLAMPEVQKELKLDDVQVDLIKQLSAEIQRKDRERFQGGGVDFRNMSPQERDKFFQEMRAEREKQEKKYGDILDPKQVARLRQLEIQQGGARSLGRKDVQDELKLTADQRARIQQTTDSERDAMRQAFEGFRGGGDMTPGQRDAVMQKSREVRTLTDAKLNGILTEPQRAQFQKMQGAAFKFPEFDPNRRRRDNTRP